MVNTFKYLLILSLLFLSGCSSINANEKSFNEEHEFFVLLSSLLNVNEDRFTFIDANGKEQPDTLKKFKELERIYIRNIEPDLPDKKFSLKRLKTIMYYSFYAHERNSAAFQEYLAADLMPIYTDNKIAFLQVLKELPFLIKPNCDRLNAFFGHEGKNEDKKSDFIVRNKKAFSEHLDDHQMKMCLRSFEG